MRKQILARALALSLALFLLLPCAAALGDTMPADLQGAKAAVLAEQAGGQAVAAQWADEKLEVGGLTRLAALLAVCEAVDQGLLQTSVSVTVSEAAARIKGPTAFLSAYEVMDAASLLKAAVMITAGDAIHALAEAAYGSSTACLQRMQARLPELGVEAAYSDIMGTGVRLSANDLIKLGRALMQSSAFTSYSSLFYDGITHEDGRATELASSNRLLKTAAGCAGVATGSSPSAGYCGVFSVSRGGAAWMCAVIGAPNASARTAAATGLIDYGFAAYEVKTLAKAEQVMVESVRVTGAKRSAVALVAGEDAVLLLPKGTGHEAQWEIPEALAAPLSMGDAVGRVRYVDEAGEELCSVELLAAEDVQKARVTDYALLLLAGWVHG